MEVDVSQDDAAVLESLLQVGMSLSALTDRQEVLEVVLREARKLARAEAGSLYVVEKDHLRFMAAQNDRLDVSAIGENLLGREVPISANSLAGFVALTGEILNLPSTYDLPDGTPFRVSRSFDAATGYRTQSVLAIPLACPDGACVGVLELINHLDASGRAHRFPRVGHDGIRSLAAMAAVTIQNYLLQEELRKAHLETIMRLSVAGEFRDDDTGEHVRRISRSSGMIAREAGLAGDQVELIEWASPMHDIGKIGVPDSILLKPGPLTRAERRIVETHPLIGGDILGEPQNELIAMARDVALTHHERWNGQGYPRGLSGEGIPQSGRIVGLADVLDALICKRCYKKAFPKQRVLEIISSERGKHFDPAIVEAFFRIHEDVLKPYELAAEQVDSPRDADRR